MSKQTPLIAEPTPVQKSFSLSQTIKQAQQQWTSLKKQVFESDLYKTYESGRKTIGEQVCTPLSTAWKNTYNDLPVQTTKLKLTYLQDYTFKERFLVLNALALGGALFTMRRLNAGNVFGKTFLAVRNATIAYVVGGLLVAPEIYNPLMSS